MHQDDGKFVAPQASDKIIRAQLFVETTADHAQHLVAYFMALRIVDVLEAVKIDEQQRNLAFFALRTRQRMTQKILEIRTIRQPRERIVIGQPVEAHFGIATLSQRGGHKQSSKRHGDHADLQGKQFAR